MINTHSLRKIIFLSGAIAGSFPLSIPRLDRCPDFCTGDIERVSDVARATEKEVFEDADTRWYTGGKLRILHEYWISPKIDRQILQSKRFTTRDVVQSLPALVISNAKQNRLTRVDQTPDRVWMLRMLNRHISLEDRQHYPV